MQHFFITGIGTNIGKTLISSILVEALEADYWKPVQAGNSPETDSEYLKTVISNKKTTIHPEAYLLKHPLSPHEAAAREQLHIKLEAINLPNTKNRLIIEGAGGLMVPLNETTLLIDLIKKLTNNVILVVSNYLGSINHTLLTVEMLRLKKLTILGIIFNGESNHSSENYILNYTQLNCLGRVPFEKNITKAVIIKHGIQFKDLLKFE